MVGPRLAPAALPALPLATLTLLLLAGATPGAHACTSIIVGSAATTDGSVLIARSDDGDDYHTVNWLFHHPARSTPALFKSNMNEFKIVLPAPGIAYFALPIEQANPWEGRNASGEASGVNAAGVALSGTESIYNSKEALAADPYNEHDGVIEDAIPSIVLPQATSAREGMALLGRLVERHGAGEGFGVLIADSKEAWYIETASGHHWLAQRVPDDSFFATGNQGRFQDVNLKDTDNVMASPGLEEFAVRARLYNPSSGKRLNFFEAFMDKNPVQKTYSHTRVKRLQQLLRDVDRDSLQGYASRPVFMRPEKKLSSGDVMAALRDHYDGSAHDPYLHMNPDETWRPMTVLRSNNGHVTQLRPAGVPFALSAVNYVAWGMTVLSPFLPLYLRGLPPDGLPLALTIGGKEPDSVSHFWKVRRLQALAFQDWPKVAPAAVAGIRAFEKDVFGRQQPAVEERYRALLEGGDERGATAELVAFTAGVVWQAGSLLDELTEQAAAALGLPGVPPDAEIVRMLAAALEAFGFEPHYDSRGPFWGRGEAPASAVLAAVGAATAAVA